MKTPIKLLILCLSFFLTLQITCFSQSLSGLPDRDFNKNDIGYGWTQTLRSNYPLFQGPGKSVVGLGNASENYQMGHQKYYNRKGLVLSIASPFKPWSNDFSEIIPSSTGYSRGVAFDHNGRLYSICNLGKDSISVAKQTNFTGGWQDFPRFYIPNAGRGEFQKMGIVKQSPTRFLFWITYSSDSLDFHNNTALVSLDSNMRPIGQPKIILSFYGVQSCLGTDNNFYILGRTAVNPSWENTQYYGTKILAFNNQNQAISNNFVSLDSNLVQGDVDVFSRQADGKFLVAGQLLQNGFAQNQSLRLLPNGAVDNTFAETRPIGVGVCWSKQQNQPIRVAWTRKNSQIHQCYQAVVGNDGGILSIRTTNLDKTWPVGRALFYHTVQQRFLFETGDFTPTVNSEIWQYDTIASIRNKFWMNADNSISNFYENQGIASQFEISKFPTFDRILVRGNELVQVNNRWHINAALIKPNGDADTIFRGIHQFPDRITRRLLVNYQRGLEYINGKFLVHIRPVYYWKNQPVAALYDTVYRFFKDGSTDDEFIPYRSGHDLVPYKNKGFISGYTVDDQNKTVEFFPPYPSRGVRLYLTELDSNASLKRTVGPFQLPASIDTVNIYNTQNLRIIGYDSKGSVWLQISVHNYWNQPVVWWSKAIYAIANLETRTIRILHLDSLAGIAPIEEIKVMPGTGHYLLKGNFSRGYNQNPYFMCQIDSTGALVSNADLPEPRFLLRPDGFSERGINWRYLNKQTDGKLLYQRYLPGNPGGNAIVRFFPDGQYDPSFLPITLKSTGTNGSAVIDNRLFLGGFHQNSYSYQDSYDDTWISYGNSNKTGIHAFKLNSSPFPVGFAQGKVEQVASPNTGCNPAGTRIPVANRVIRSGTSDQLAFTNSNGQFTLALPIGNHSISQDLGGNALQRQVCPPSASPNLSLSLPSVGTVSIGNNFINQTYGCPRLGITMGTPRFRLCSRGQVAIWYFNDGVVAEPNARIRLNLPNIMKIESASRPFSTLPDSSVVFDIGNLGPNQRGVILIKDTIGCPGTIDSTQRACFSSRIEPLNLCAEVVPSQINWDGAWLDAWAKYQASSGQIKVVIKNKGANMVDSVEANVSSVNGSDKFRIKLLAGDSIVKSFPAAMQGTFQLSLEQPKNCPAGSFGQLFHSGTNTATSYLSFGNGWFESQTTTACPPFRYSYDPNEKIVFPDGNIQAGTQLDYTIHFENYGNDTAYAVSVVDSLPAGLDLTTFRFKGSSHPCSIVFEGDSAQPIFTFHFRGIKLTAKRQDSVLSKGQFSFSVQTIAEAQPGFKWKNRAHIYFDQNEAIITNTVVNKIPLVTEVRSRIPSKKQDVNVYPNPNKGSFTVAISNYVPGRIVQIYTIQGMLALEAFPDVDGKLEINNLNPGVYYVKSEGVKTRSVMVNP